MGKGSKKTRGVCLAILAGSCLGTVVVQQGIDRAHSAQGGKEEFLYIPEGKFLRTLSLGHEGLLADIYWTRAVQYFGRKRIDQSPRFDLLGPLLRIATTLDPHLIIAYRFGAIFLSEKPPRGAGRPKEALQLLRKGIVANPDYWRFWHDLGFIYYWDLKDYPAAARAYLTGSQQPGAQIWMKVMAASIAREGGADSTSRLLWAQILREADSESIRRNAQDHLAAFRAKEDLEHLVALLDVYKKREGSPASSLADLVAAGMLRGIPLDPSGIPYRINRKGGVELGPGSRVDLRLLN